MRPLHRQTYCMPAMLRALIAQLLCTYIFSTAKGTILTFVLMRTGAKTLPDSVKTYLSVLALSNPTSNVHLLVEKNSPLENYDFSELFPRVHVFPLLNDTEHYVGKVMLARIHLYKEHLCSPSLSNSESSYVFTDDDILVIKDVSQDISFKRKFDIGFTWHPNESGYINMGVLLVRGSNDSLGKACELFELAERRFEEKYMHMANWLGDQHAVSDILGGKQLFRRRPVEFCTSFNDIRVCFFDRARLNGTPGKSIKRNTCILHYKGKHRKDKQFPDSVLYMKGGYEALIKKYYRKGRVEGK